MTPGDLIADRYRLREPIATGGMGDVWRADDEVLGRSVAIKAMRSEVRADPTFSARFRLEARSMAALQHPGIVSVYDYGEVDDDSHGYAYLVMPLVEGESLGARVGRDGRLSPAATMNVVAQVARALQAVHDAGIIHRDVKPENVLIDDAGRAVLVDFGVVRAVTATAGDLTGAGQVIGTAGYMAPEQVSRRPLTPATDLYALGAVAYRCLSGAPPFVGGTPAAIALCHVYDEPPPLPDDVPPAVRGVVATAITKDPTQRYDSAAAMADAAEAAVGRAPLAPAQRGIAPPVSPRRADQTLDMPAIGRSTSGKAARVLALVAVLAIAGIVLTLALQGGARPNSDPELTTPTSTPSTHANNGTGIGKSGKPTPATSTGAATNPVTQPSATQPSTTQPSTTPPSTTPPSTTPPSTTRTDTSSPRPTGSGSTGSGTSGTGSSGTGTSGTGSSGTGSVGDSGNNAGAPGPSS